MVHFLGALDFGRFNGEVVVDMDLKVELPVSVVSFLWFNRYGEIADVIGIWKRYLD